MLYLGTPIIAPKSSCYVNSTSEEIGLSGMAVLPIAYVQGLRHCQRQQHKKLIITLWISLYCIVAWENVSDKQVQMLSLRVSQ